MADAAPLVMRASQLEPDPRSQSYPDAVEIEIRAGFCDPDPELLPEARRCGRRSRRRQPLDELAEGRYKQVIDFALGLSHGVFT